MRSYPSDTKIGSTKGDKDNKPPQQSTKSEAKKSSLWQLLWRTTSTSHEKGAPLTEKSGLLANKRN